MFEMKKHLAAHLYQQGRQAYLSKPFTPGAFLERVRGILPSTLKCADLLFPEPELLAPC